MKKWILLFAALTGACSSDSLNADYAPKFEGTWKTGIMDEDGYKTQAQWTISRASDNVVNIAIIRTVIYGNDGYDIPGTMAAVKLKDRETLDIDYKAGDQSRGYCGIRGSAVLDGDKLKVDTRTVCPGEDENPVHQEFIRQ